MELRCDISIADRYTSKPQQARILSETWFAANAYCLACESDKLDATAANTKALDFTCCNCAHRYELKAFEIKPKKTLVDGAYGTMIARILNGTAPTLMMLERNTKWEIQGLTAIHHSFLTMNVIAQRKPLALTARRAGWVGCNIRLDQIPQDAQIIVIGEGKVNVRSLVRKKFQQFEPLNAIAPLTRGWTTLTLKAIRDLERNTFSLDELYDKHSLFSEAYPANLNIKPKLRQQLQVLRDLNYIRFLGQGSYKLLI